MKRKDAFYDKNAVFINAALLAVHAKSEISLFRQKDLKFYIELLTNWMETSFKGSGLEIQNTQVQRLLNELSNEGFLKKEQKGKSPYYYFTSLGLLEIATRLVNDDALMNLENFFFLYHFISLYLEKIENLVIGKKGNLSKSYQIEIKHLLSPKNLIERQKARISKEIEKLESRIDEAYKMNELANNLTKQGFKINEVIKEIEKKYPYQLNGQKNLNELFKSLSYDIALIELTKAPKHRAQSMWEPLLAHYKNYNQILISLSILH